MRYNGTVYRPPIEGTTLLVPATEGCTHNACTFCSMYREVRFRPVPEDAIKEHLEVETCKCTDKSLKAAASACNCKVRHFPKPMKASCRRTPHAFTTCRPLPFWDEVTVWHAIMRARFSEMSRLSKLVKE